MRRKKLLQKMEKMKKQRVYDIDHGNSVQEVKNLTINKIVHPILYHGLNVMNKVKGYKIHIKGEFPKKQDRPVIISPNHLRKTDIEMIMNAIPEHMILVSGDFINVHGKFDGTLLEKNGIIYFDMDDAVDRRNVKEVERQILNTGKNILPFYEAAWNLSPNKIVYDGYYSIVQTAIDTEALVLPVAFEQPVDFSLNDKDIYISIGEPIDFSEIYLTNNKKRQLSHSEKQEGLEIIKTAISTMLYEIWEDHCIVKRSDIPADFWDSYKRKILSEWFFTEEEIEHKHFVDKKKASLDYDVVFKHLYNIEYNKNNAFLLK